MKRALIIGGTKGIGAAIATKFRESGSEVFAWGRQDLDVRDYDQIRKKEFPSNLDVFVYCAGVMKLGPFEKITFERYSNTINTNLTGAFFSSQKVIEKLNNQAHIVNICSVSGFFPSSSEFDYCISKAGLHMLTRCLAKEYSGRFHVNSISPGFVETQLVSQDKIPDFLLDYIPVKRPAYPTEIADLVFYITQSSYFSGMNFIFDGGLLAKHDGPSFPMEEIE